GHHVGARPARAESCRSASNCAPGETLDFTGRQAGPATGAYWVHGPDHRDNPRRDPRHRACRHGCGRDLGNIQGVLHHRADRDGGVHRRVARGQALPARLARRGRSRERADLPGPADCCEIVTSRGNPSGGRGRRSGMIRHLGGKDAAVLAGCLLVISGGTGGAVQRAVHQNAAMPSGPVRLTSFHGCGEELAALRKAAEASVGPYGLPSLASSVNGAGYPTAAAGASRAAAGAGAAAAAPAAVPAHSGTNDYVAGVDEPDLVKTDGRRIVTVADGVLEVVDAASRTVTGRLDLSAAGGGMAYQLPNLLLSGGHALLLASAGPVAGGATRSGGYRQPAYGSRLFLIDLAGHPSVISSYAIDGSLIGARQVGPAVRVVIGS